MIAESKAAIVLELMKRKEGATLSEIAKATDWQNHSIRGFVSGHVTHRLLQEPQRATIRCVPFGVLHDVA